MARYRGPKTKIARRMGEPIFGPDSSFEKRKYPPGHEALQFIQDNVDDHDTYPKRI